MKLILSLFVVILTGCTGSGGGSDSSGGGTISPKVDSSFMFFKANLTGTNSLYMTKSTSEDPVKVDEEVSLYINLKNNYVLYIKKNGSNQDSPYLYNYKTKTTVDIRSELGISSNTNMNLSNYEFNKGSDSVSYSVLSFLCNDGSNNNVCSVSFTDTYKIEKLSYTSQYLGSQIIKGKVSLCYFSTSLKCLVSGYDQFSKEISYFTLNVPNPSSSWDHIDSIFSFDDHFMVKGGTDSDDKYFVYNSSYAYIRTTSIVNKDFSVLKDSGSNLLVLANLDGENKYWEFNFLTDSLNSVVSGDGIVSPNFLYHGEDDDYYYVSVTLDNEGSELFRVNKSNWSSVRLTDTSGAASTTVESFNESYMVVVENSNRTVYKNNSGSLTPLSLSYDDTKALYILGVFNDQYIFLGSSNSYDNIIMTLSSDLEEYSQVRGNSNDPEISSISFE